MACFIVPGGEAVVTTIIQKIIEKKERDTAGERPQIKQPRGKWSQRLHWLNVMLWGGCLLLALEHIWHGEVVPWPPFLTAMETPGEVGPMLHEVATYGVTMAVVVTVVWGIMVLVAELRAKATSLSGTKQTSVGEGA